MAPDGIGAMVDPERSDTAGGRYAEAGPEDAERVGAAVLTVSSTASLDADPAGDAIETVLDDAGYGIATRELVRTDYDRVQSAIDSLVGRKDVRVLVVAGGIGVGPDDVTVEAVDALFEKRLPGFGELVRHLAHEKAGTGSIGSRAVAGIADGVPVFCISDDEQVARRDVEAVIAPEAARLAAAAAPDDEGEDAGNGV